jgi:hypothetical protein
VATGAAAPYVQPRLDGRESDYFEWRDAVRIDPAALSGSMHQTAGWIRELRYGIDESSLYLRVTIGSDAGVEGAALLVEAAGDFGAAARVPLDGAARGAPAWLGPAEAAADDEGAYARDQYVEARLPFARFGVGAGAALEWRLVVARDGRRDEIVPRDGAFRVERPRADRRLTHWSAT